MVEKVALELAALKCKKYSLHRKTFFLHMSSVTFYFLLVFILNCYVTQNL